MGLFCPACSSFSVDNFAVNDKNRFFVLKNSNCILLIDLKLMKKYIFSLALWAVTCVSQVSAQSPFGSTRADYGVRGSVRTMTQTCNKPFVSEEGVTEGKNKMLNAQNYTLSFSIQGRVIEASDVNLAGGYSQRTTFDYGRTRKRMEKATDYMYNMSGELLNTRNVEFDAQGKPLSSKWYIGAVPLTVKNYYYNDNHQLIRLRESFLPRIGGNYYQVEYSPEGLPVAIEHYKQRGKLKKRYVYQYNNEGKVVSVVECNSQKQVVGSSNYAYNEQGDVVMAQAVLDNHRGMELLAELFGSQGMPPGIKHRMGTYTIAYQYDEEGNWVQSLISFKDEPTVVYAREISYF